MEITLLLLQVLTVIGLIAVLVLPVRTVTVIEQPNSDLCVLLFQPTGSTNTCE